MNKNNLIFILTLPFVMFIAPFVYVQTVTIGKQVWSTKNLDVSKFRNGDIIPEAKTEEEWQRACENKQPAWCYYNNDPKNGLKYGKLYNWHAVNDLRGLAPAGYHIPSDAEWTQLTDFLGSDAGTKMKSTSGWGVMENVPCPNCKDRNDEYRKKVPCHVCKDTRSSGQKLVSKGNGTNSSGFSCLPGGNRSYDGSFYDIGEYGSWWSSTEFSTDFAWFRFLSYGSGFVFRDYFSKQEGMSVRCLRD